MLTPLLLIPGAFCGGWAFEALRPELAAAGREVVAFDPPGQTPGDPPPSLLSITEYAAGVAEASRRLSVPPVLVGHSMGGLVAQLAAARTKVAGLVLLAPSPAWGSAPTSAMELGSGPSLALLLGPYWLGTVAPDWPVMRSHTFDRLPSDEARALYARTRPDSGRALYETLQWWADPTLAAMVPPLDLPALVITGAEDRVHPPVATRATAARLRAEHRVLPGVSHWTLGGPGTEGLAGMILEFAGGL